MPIAAAAQVVDRVAELQHYCGSTARWFAKLDGIPLRFMDSAEAADPHRIPFLIGDYLNPETAELGEHRVAPLTAAQHSARGDKNRRLPLAGANGGAHPLLRRPRPFPGRGLVIPSPRPLRRG